MNTAFAFELGYSAFIKKLPGLLRIVGAGALVVAMYGFLALGWQSGNDVLRYLMMLGHTGLLSVIGLASGHWLKEGKGARLLLTLALVSVPANFAILGAFVFSQTSAIDVASYPHYVAWAVGSLPAALMTTAGALLVLVPVTLVGFTVLARGMSGTLSLLFLVSNLALLLPLRDPQWIALLVSLLTAGVVWSSRRAAHDRSVARTGEGVTALGLQLLPLGVLLGRTLWLYAFDLFLATVVAGTLFFVLRQISLYLQPGSVPRDLLDSVSLAPAVSVALLLSNALFATGVFPDAWVFPLGSVASALLVYDIARRNVSHAGLYRRMAVLLLLVGMLGNLVLFSDTLAALACVAVGTMLLARGCRARQLSLLGGGLLLSLVGVVHQLIDLIRHFDLASWAGLAILGTLSIVFASVLESQSGRLRFWIEAWRERLSAWEK
jgi:hypothetical protein